MLKLRTEALLEARGRKAKKIKEINKKESDLFGENVFTLPKMKQYLSQNTYKYIADAIEKGQAVPRNIASDVASAMKIWALERGATHYTHWFHPLNGASAEKHDSFLDVNIDGSAIESFAGEQLAQQEPDASSFPNGGLRDTFEARGYTAWDPASPAFIKNNTLFIPTIFISYTGHALDFKTPLLKSLNALDNAATEVCNYFDKKVGKVTTTLGWEQEYFLIDEALFNARPDLMMTGRTLMGHSAAKDQQLDDHYFGAIPQRVTAFMRDLEIEAHKLGIPVTTRHNEVAPGQFECAPKFEEANLAIDHNQLLMTLMSDIAREHDFVVLLHEKPFKDINGSGKHNNFSMATDTGVNLLSPGKNAQSNLQFLVFLVNTIQAVYNHADLLRGSIASAGNEHRLGAAEAPPAIISVFLGKFLTQTLDEIETQVSAQPMTPEERKALKLNVGKIPQILLDNTDRNRTSPFAFTGNRFEFRAVGSSANCSAPMTVLCSAVAQQLKRFKSEVDTLIDKGITQEEAIFKILKKYIISSKPIRFEGNGYGEEWIKEAQQRGLSNVPETVDALKSFLTPTTLDLFRELEVLTETEIHARYEIKNETFTKIIQIEARVLGDLAINHIVPTAIKYQTVLIKNVKGLKELYNENQFKEIASSQLETITQISQHINEIKKGVANMIEERKKANILRSQIEKAEAYATKVKPFLETIRYHIDKLELMIDNDIWTLPKYRELLFLK